MNIPMIEDIQVNEIDEEVVTDERETAVHFGFLGGGQAGGKLAQQFYNIGYRRILAVNTTEQDMAGLTFPGRLIVGGGISGAGKNPKVGKKAAEDSREDILRACRKSFGTDIEHIMVLASAGGGTGSGACPVLIDIAKDYLVSLGKKPQVGVIVTTPKKSEGPTVNANAASLMANLQAQVDAKSIAPLVIADNEKITKSYPRVSIAKFYEVANQSIARLFSIFNELSCESSEFGNMDRADYKTILDAGTMVFGMSTIDKADSSDTALAEAAERNIKSGMLADVSLKGATHAGAIICASRAQLENIPQASFDMAFQTLCRTLASSDLLLHSGVYEGPETLGSKVILYTIVGGLGAKG